MSQIRHTNSLLRESLRFQGAAAAVPWPVISPSGVTTDGAYLPKNTTLTILTLAAGLDVAVHDDPIIFDPFRLSRNGAKHHGGFDSLDPPMPEWGVSTFAHLGRFLVDFPYHSILVHLLTFYKV
jgi:cytochrome P450